MLLNADPCIDGQQFFSNGGTRVELEAQAGARYAAEKFGGTR